MADDIAIVVKGLLSLCALGILAYLLWDMAPVWWEIHQDEKAQRKAERAYQRSLRK